MVSTVPNKMVTLAYTQNSYGTKTLETLIKTHRRVLGTSNLAYIVLLVQGRISPNTGLSICPLAVVVVICTAVIFPYGGLVDVYPWDGLPFHILYLEEAIFPVASIYGNLR